MILSTEIDIKVKVQKDLKYIENDIITKQVNSKYCKFSKPLNAFSCIDMEPTQYIKYWSSVYRNHPDELNQILEACYKVLSEPKYSKEDMIKLIKQSNDRDSEKAKAIKLLGGKYNG